MGASCPGKTRALPSMGFKGLAGFLAGFMWFCSALKKIHTEAFSIMIGFRGMFSCNLIRARTFCMLTWMIRKGFGLQASFAADAPHLGTPLLHLNPQPRLARSPKPWFRVRSCAVWGFLTPLHPKPTITRPPSPNTRAAACPTRKSKTPSEVGDQPTAFFTRYLP